MELLELLDGRKMKDHESKKKLALFSNYLQNPTDINIMIHDIS